MKYLLRSICVKCVPSLHQVLCTIAIRKERDLAFLLERRPIATDGTIKSDNRLEDAAVVMCMMPVFRWKHDVARLIADEVLVIRGNQQKLSLPASSCAALVRHVEDSSLPFLRMNAVSQQFNSSAAIADIQSRPPHKILQRGRLAALEVLVGEAHKGLVSVHRRSRLHLIDCERIGRLHGQ